MVVIRLSRGGTNKKPFYNIMVADKRSARDGPASKWASLADASSTAGTAELKQFHLPVRVPPCALRAFDRALLLPHRQ